MNEKENNVDQGSLTPVLSIVTITYNDSVNLRKTLESLKNQSNQNFELCVVDGASSDDTGSVISNYDSFINVFVSETDDGIYDAMNKGISLSTGKFLLFINAGDELHDEHVVDKILNSCQSEDVIYYSDAKYIRPNGEGFIFNASHDHIKSKMPFNHQSVLIPRKIHITHLYNTYYKISSDYDLMLRLYERGVEFSKLDFLIAKHHLDGVSVTSPFLSCLESVHSHVVNFREIKFKETEYYGEYFIREIFHNSPIMSKIVLFLYLVFEKQALGTIVKILYRKLFK